jgi:high-affinity iron transporter
MLATLVIGLREGLEAALIVGIIAAFLRRNGKSLAAMWAGVILAVLLSIGVGVGLSLLEQALPQAHQEAMESIIGAIAVFFVTGMIVWMNTHARQMKKELEAEAAAALGQGSTLALAVMAFLAVLKEGFETSVFLLATFSAAQSAWLAAAGAVLGLLLAVAIGWGIYAGGVRLNLSRFFRITGAFLILVAAGLVITALRTAHEAGWLNAGQQPTVNLAWLVAPGTIQSALITGVLGIPADPRRVELIGWFAYIIPVAAYVYWPRAWRLSMRGAIRLRFGVAAGLLLVAVGLAAFYPPVRPDLPVAVPVLAGSAAGTARFTPAGGATPAALIVQPAGGDATTLTLPSNDGHPAAHAGLAATAWSVTSDERPADAPKTLTIDQVVELAGGRVPVGLNPRQHPGPYQATWSVHRTTEVWTVGAVLLDATARTRTIVSLSGGGLATPRTLSVSAGAVPGAAGWQVDPAYRDRAAATLKGLAAARTEGQFWAVELPIALALVALLIAAFAARALILGRAAPDKPVQQTGRRAGDGHAKGTPHAAN